MTTTTTGLGDVPGLRGFDDEGHPTFDRDQLDDQLKAIDNRMIDDDGVGLRRREVLDGLHALGEDEAFAPYIDAIAEVAPALIERAYRRQTALRAAGIGPHDRQAIWRRHTVEAIEAHRAAYDRLAEQVGLSVEPGALSDDQLYHVWGAINPALSHGVRAIYAGGIIRRTTRA